MSNWVSVNSRLPKKDGRYRVMVKDAYGDLQEHDAQFDCAVWWPYDDTQNLDSRVIMWKKKKRKA